MSPRWIRRIVLVVFVCGIGGMIAGSIDENHGTAITFGLLSVAAALALILVTAVAPPGALGAPQGPDEAAAEDLEMRIRALVAAGADETAVRELVQAAVDMGTGRRGMEQPAADRSPVA